MFIEAINVIAEVATAAASFGAAFCCHSVKSKFL